EMTSTDAMRILQHASFYIFSTRVIGGPGKTMRGSVEVWQAMATLDQCRRELAGTALEGAAALRDGDSNRFALEPGRVPAQPQSRAHALHLSFDHTWSGEELKCFTS